MYTGKVFVTLKKAVLDPQGDTVKKSLHTMGYKEVKDVRVGKYIEVKIDGDTRQEVQDRLDEMCRKLLANPVIEEFRIEIAEDGQ
ncbi:MAG: phosphoribosylformylglycinamidine synthase subunit PurS [Syntrophomonadaceae bacterium]|nr:phosphoribosylformylglycinamidine synthase subunit PurS [Syntrophomonadaceae bacterium]